MEFLTCFHRGVDVGTLHNQGCTWCVGAWKEEVTPIANVDGVWATTSWNEDICYDPVVHGVARFQASFIVNGVDDTFGTKFFPVNVCNWQPCLEETQQVIMRKPIGIFTTSTA